MNNLEARIAKLEIRALERRVPPLLMYCSFNQSFDEAKAAYEQQHGFKLPTNAQIIEFVVVGSEQET